MCLAVLAVVALAGGGLRMTLGPLRISATDPSRLLLEAAAIWLIAEVVSSGPRRRRGISLAIGALLLAAVADSSPARVGDGAEYVAMALNLSRGAAPSVMPGERESLTNEMGRMPGFEQSSIDTPLVGRDARQDFYHFWLYPLIVSPFVFLSQWAPVHVNYAFTAVNLLLFAGLLSWLVRKDAPDIAALLAAGPLLWWIDKAHAEVLLFVTLAFAVLLMDTWPAAALIAAGIATAQNPAAGVVFLACLVSTLLRGRTRDIPIPALVVALVLAAAAPVYYQWHLGVWSPLSSTVGREFPGVRALVTPLVDPNLGLLPHAPILVAVAVVGLWRQSRRTLVTTTAVAVSQLIVFAMPANINHGGTPGMSRYALWLLALSTPLLLAGSHWWSARHPAIWRAAAAVSIASCVFLFRPAWTDRAGDSPNWLASTLWTQWPAIDNPLPEVFAERTTGSTNESFVPSATTGCEKALIAGDGQDAWWPLPCVARPAPDVCTEAGALCYVNDGEFAKAPRQHAFAFETAINRAWTWKNMARFDSVLNRLGARPRFVRLSDEGGRIDDVRNLAQLYIVEGTTGAAAWVRSMAPPNNGGVRVHVRVASTLELLDATALAPLVAPLELTPGTHDVPLTATTSLVVVVSDR